MWLGLWIALLTSMVQGAEPTQYRRLSVPDYRDKMKAGWIGQIAGVSWGAPTEFKFRGCIIPEEKMPKWQPSLINEAFVQDDLYVEMTFLSAQKLARQTIVKEEGRIEKDTNGEEVFVIPVQPARPSQLEQSWAPGSIAESKFSEAEMARILIKTK